MANRLFNSQFRYGFIRMPVSLMLQITFGTSGAPTLTYGPGIKSVTRNSAGDYTIALQDTYNGLLCAKHVFDETNNSGTAPASPGMFIKSNTVSSKTAPALEVVFNAAGTATDPASTESVLIELILSNSSITPGTAA